MLGKKLFVWPAVRLRLKAKWFIDVPGRGERYNHRLLRGESGTFPGILRWKAFTTLLRLYCKSLRVRDYFFNCVHQANHCKVRMLDRSFWKLEKLSDAHPNSGVRKVWEGRLFQVLFEYQTWISVETYRSCKSFVQCACKSEYILCRVCVFFCGFLKQNSPPSESCTVPLNIPDSSFIVSALVSSCMLHLVNGTLAQRKNTHAQHLV